MLYCCYLHHALLLLITFISILSQVIQVGRQLLLHHSQVTLQVTLDEPSFSRCLALYHLFVSPSYHISHGCTTLLLSYCFTLSYPLFASFVMVVAGGFSDISLASID